MNCAWNTLINLLPVWTRRDVNAYESSLLEIRLRIGIPPELITTKGNYFLRKAVCPEDLSLVINTASKYSPWAANTTDKGFITASGGHRIGICGTAAVQNGNTIGIRTPTSLCIRVARDISGIAANLAKYDCSMLIIGKPGSGKTTLLRDLIRQKADKMNGSIAVVDERCELFPTAQGNMVFQPGMRTDVLTGCSKADGISMVLRSMCPSYIAVDEITEKSDCEALVNALGCGVSLLATAHAGSRDDLFARPIYAPLLKYNLFQTLVILKPDKTWTMEELRV